MAKYRDKDEYSFLNFFSSAPMSEKISYHLTGYKRNTTYDWFLVPMFSIMFIIFGIMALNSEYDAIINFVAIPLIVGGIILAILSIIIIVCEAESKKCDKKINELKAQIKQVDDEIDRRRKENEKLYRRMNNY